jgi:hypothetical protein
MTSAQTINWIVNLTLSTKAAMGSNYYITHAPQAPYFSSINPSSTMWGGPLGGYTAVEFLAGSAIDFYNVQFYNQNSCYLSYNGIFTSSIFDTGCEFPGTSVAEISSYGVPINKIVVGKPVIVQNAGSGYVTPSVLNTAFITAQQSIGWISGLMGWEWQSPTINTAWLTTIFSGFNLTGTTTTTGSSSTTTGSTSTTGSSSTTGSTSTTGSSSTTGSPSNTCFQCGTCNICYSS